MNVRLESLARCFRGVLPSKLATCSADGEPNVAFVSQIDYVDSGHVAVSCQFFNKTRRNLGESPLATAQVYDPLTFEAYKLRLRYLRSETEGPLFDTMSLRIDAIASQTGMAGVFRLLSADVFEVLSIERVEGFLDEAPQQERLDPSFERAGPLTELRGLQAISARINQAVHLEELLTGVLRAFDEIFRFPHGMVLLPDETGERLVALASHGYGGSGIGAEVRVGEGLIGTVAQQRRLLRVSSVDGELRYGRAIRGRVEEAGGKALAPEIPLPGLPDAQSHMAIPLLLQDRLVGVLAVESRDPLCFAEWHEAFLEIIANQIAMGIDAMLDDGEAEAPAAGRAPGAMVAQDAPQRRQFCFYKNDDCVFADGEYLIRNVPGKILWKLLNAFQQEGRNDFSNRELRLDPSLGLPPIKDNLESRLILLRKRLEQKCPDVRLVPTGRGRFRLELDCNVELQERESA
ncbi:GAF domain-containing protein [Vulgatibacter sp.]|uniref:GAF domain-containing protein n=1 Tax=Vulgatibacter sp. TaxID=1971226 RepID=UPI003564603E